MLKLGNNTLADEAKRQYYRCAVSFWNLQSSRDDSGFCAAVADLYRVLTKYRTTEIQDDTIRAAVDRALTSETKLQNGRLTIDSKDIDFDYYSVIDLVGFDRWRKVHLNDDEQANALIPGEIRQSNLADMFPAIFDFDIYETSTEWIEKCKAYSHFCEIMARQVIDASADVSTWERLLVRLQANRETMVQQFEESRHTGEVKTTPSTDASEQCNAPKTKCGKVNDDSLPPVADAKLIECFQVFQNCANNHRGKYKTTEADWAAIALYVIPQKDRKNVPRKEIISTLSKGASGIGKITNYTEDRLDKFVKNSRSWHREKVSCKLDYYEFMRKFLAWKDSSKVTGKVTGQ
jgi:hypothetical protein